MDVSIHIIGSRAYIDHSVPSPSWYWGWEWSRLPCQKLVSCLPGVGN